MTTHQERSDPNDELAFEDAEPSNHDREVIAGIGRLIESHMIDDFEARHGRRPFANRKPEARH